MAKEFSIEELDRMYDDAMEWEPPVQISPVDRQNILQKMLEKKQKLQGEDVNA